MPSKTTFPRSSVYHSALKEATAEEGLWIAFDTVTDSKREGNPPLATFTIDGESRRYTYMVENDLIRKHIEALPRGTFHYIRASGAKEAAVLHVEDETGREIPAPNGSAPKGPRQEAAESARAARQPAPSGGPESLARTLWRCLQAAHDLEEAYAKKYGQPPTEVAKTLAISMAIEHFRGNAAPITEPR